MNPTPDRRCPNTVHLIVMGVILLGWTALLIMGVMLVQHQPPPNEIWAFLGMIVTGLFALPAHIPSATDRVGQATDTMPTTTTTVEPDAVTTVTQGADGGTSPVAKNATKDGVAG